MTNEPSFLRSLLNARAMLRGLVLALAGMGSFWLATMILDRDAPIHYKGASALSDSVPQGGSIDVEYSVFRSRVCAATALRYLTDAKGTKHAIPSWTVGLSPDPGPETYRRTITIPQVAAIGPASYVVTISYYCNIVHRLGFPIVVATPPIAFGITPGPIMILPPMLPALPGTDDE